MFLSKWIKVCQKFVCGEIIYYNQTKKRRRMMINLILVVGVIGLFLFGGFEAKAADTTIKGTTSNSSAAALEVTNSLDGSLLYVRNDGNVGVGDTSPAYLLTVGNGDLFGVNSSGNLAKINNVTYSWPSDDGDVGEQLQTDGSGNLTWEAPGTTIPSGVIVMWSGSIAIIPSGWALCNGSNGTPDLRDRFIVGARQDDSGVAKTNVTGSLTQTGGVATHSHGVGTYDSSAVSAGTPSGTVSQPTFTGTAFTAVINHTHPANISDPGHQHNEGFRNTGTAGAVGVQGSSTANNANIANGIASNTTGITATTSNPTGGVASITPAGTVSQPTFTGDAMATHDHTLSGSSETVSNLSPYYALAFIMKL
jgi:hypothetical protein